jgi:glycosyltransferase involved in cell wall biosynthesis
MGMETSEKKATLSIGILTRNEAHQLVRCLRSAEFADEVIVVDGGSTDDTVELAEREGARAYKYPDWQGFAAQRNRLLSHVTGDYVFFLDADEEITPALQKEILAAVCTGEKAVWKVNWTVVAFGRELRYFLSQSSIERLFKRSSLIQFEGLVHEKAVVNPVNLVRHTFHAKLIHHSRRTVRGSLEKLTQYSMLGAAKRAAAGRQGGVMRGLASSIAIFFRLYILRLGFTGGGPGFLFCFFIALECLFRYAALRFDRLTLAANITR